MMDIDSINCIDALKELKNGAILIDVRTNQEVKSIAFDIKGVINTEAFRLYEMLDSLPKDKLFILADTEDEKSWRGAIILMNNGFKNVAFLAGGMKEWLCMGFPVIKSSEYLDAFPKCGCCG